MSPADVGLAYARVLHLFANYKWTGPADPAIRTAARLRSLGLDVVFAQAGFVHPGGEHWMSQALWRWRLPVVTGLQLRKHFHARTLPGEVRRLRAILRRDRYRLLHCHLPADHLLAALACRALAEPPLVVRTLYDPEPPQRRWRERFAFARTAGIVVPTSAVGAGVQQRFGLPAARVLLQEPVTEPRGPGPDLRARWGLGPRRRVIGITARVQPHRRFDLLWATLRAVVDRVPDAVLVLLGRGNEHDTKTLVTEPIARLGLQQHVVLPGWLAEPDYSAALRSLDLFLFLVPGSDGTCRAVREAMAAGLPVVATERGMLPALVGPRPEQTAAGVIVAEAALPLANAIVDLLQDDDRRRATGAAALARARTAMDPDTAARALAAFYGQLLAAASGSAQ